MAGRGNESDTTADLRRLDWQLGRLIEVNADGEISARRIRRHFFPQLRQGGRPEEVRENLKRYNHPILCTEFMARGNGSMFDPHLGYMKDENVAAYCWGFVDGKTQTIYPWDSWKKQYTAEPSQWFHDILRRDGTPYDANEVRYIKSVTRDAKKKRGAHSKATSSARKTEIIAAFSE